MEFLSKRLLFNISKWNGSKQRQMWQQNQSDQISRVQSQRSNDKTIVSIVPRTIVCSSSERARNRHKTHPFTRHLNLSSCGTDNQTTRIEFLEGNTCTGMVWRGVAWRNKPYKLHQHLKYCIYTSKTST